MRPEQVTALVALEEQLVDLFSAECKPGEWPDMKTVQSRGDRYWHKKNALATLTLVGRIQTVLRDARTDGGAAGEEGKGEPRSGDGEASIEREAAALEKQGVALLRRHEKRRR
jgi:hypothetical protein